METRELPQFDKGHTWNTQPYNGEQQDASIWDQEFLSLGVSVLLLAQDSFLPWFWSTVPIHKQSSGLTFFFLHIQVIDSNNELLEYSTKFKLFPQLIVMLWKRAAGDSPATNVFITSS
jgi:hypothetical protein